MHDFDRVIDRRSTDSAKWRAYPPDVLPLWVADMDFPAPEPVIQALRERVEHGIYGYGWKLEATQLHEAVVDWLARRCGWTVSPEAIVPIPGVIPGLNLAGRVLAAPGDGVLIETPAYPPIQRVPPNVGLRLDEVELTRDLDGRYGLDLEAFERAIRPDTRMFLLCNPHNPVGRVWTREELAGMAEVCLRRGLGICADEIHGDLVFSGHRHVPMASLGPEIAARTITLLAPSKTFNLAGLKSAVAVIPDAALRERFLAARLDLVPAVNILGYVATTVAYRDGEPWLKALLGYLEASRDTLAEAVRTRLPGVAMAPPEGTYLGWLDCRAALPDDDPYRVFLERARVALNDGATFGRPGRGFVRLNFGCPRATLLQALDRMARALEARP